MKTLLVDGHALFREGLAMLITQGFPELELLQAGDVGDMLAQVERHPDLRLVLLDLALPDAEGTRGLLQLRTHAPQATVIVLSGDASSETVLDAIGAGAAGFIPKTSRSDAMRQALRVVLDGGVYLPPSLRQSAIADEGAAPAVRARPAVDLAGLTPRQCDVLRLLIEGKPNKLICRELELSESTVKTHLASIFRRLGATSRTQAVVAAGRMGLCLGPAIGAPS
jgi:DNA-binding NarL/FixJ family response regulator